MTKEQTIINRLNEGMTQGKWYKTENVYHIARGPAGKDRIKTGTVTSAISVLSRFGGLTKNTSNGTLQRTHTLTTGPLQEYRNTMHSPTHVPKFRKGTNRTQTNTTTSENEYVTVTQKLCDTTRKLIAAGFVTTEIAPMLQVTTDTVNGIINNSYSLSSYLDSLKRNEPLTMPDLERAIHTDHDRLVYLTQLARWTTRKLEEIGNKLNNPNT